VAVVWVPSLLRHLTGGADQVQVSGTNLRQVIESLEARYPGLEEQLVDDDGRINRTMAVAIDGSTTDLGLLAPVGENSEIHFIPAVQGG